MISWILHCTPGPEVIKLEYSLGLKIKRKDWLLADTCPQATNHCALLFWVENEPGQSDKKALSTVFFFFFFFFFFFYYYYYYLSSANFTEVKWSI